MMKLDERLDGTRMRSLRRMAAKALAQGTNSDADDVLDFTEMIGYLADRGALDTRMIWNNFYPWIHHYMFAARAYVEEQQRLDPTVWCCAVRLDRRLAAVEKRKRRCPLSNTVSTDQELKDFLSDEAELA